MSDDQQQAYRKQARAIKAQVEQDLAQVYRFDTVAPRLNNIFHMADANLRHFFPDMDQSQRSTLIADMLFEQRMAVRDQSDFQLVESTRLDDQAGALAFAAAGRPHIFCTYHTGSFRHTFHFLLRAGIDCLLFVSGKTLQQQGESFLRDAQLGKVKQGWTGSLSTIEAENRNSLLLALRALKKGRSVVIFIDGNVGVGANKDNSSLTSVDFFGKELMARNGVAYLSHVSGVPIVPLMCRRDADCGLTLTLHEAITPDQTEREAFVGAATRTLYRLLNREVAAALGQWEGWLYVQRFLKRQPAELCDDEHVLAPPPQAGRRMTADLARFALLLFSAQPILLDKAKHRCVMLDAATARVFREVAGGKTQVEARDISTAGVRRLVQLGALYQ